MTAPIATGQVTIEYFYLSRFGVMSKFLLTIFNLLGALCICAQAPNFGWSVQEITIPEPARTTIQTNAGYAAAPRCWRLNACLDNPNYELQAVYGTATHPWLLNTTGDFYQSPFGSDLASNVNPVLFPAVPALEYDSWFCLGNDPYVGNIASVPSPLYDPFIIFESGNGFYVNDATGSSVIGVWSSGNSEGLPNGDNAILVAQLTCESGEVISGQFNVQVRRLNPDGSIFIPVEIYAIVGITWSNVNDLDPCPVVLLPVTLTSFSAKPETERVLLQWTTETEQNVDRFEVERSKDGVDFEYVTTVEANGNTTSLSMYGAHDNSPLTGYSYYRLKAVDTNGEFDYSDLRRVEFRPANAEVYPNPTRGKVTISGLSDDIEHVRLLDSRGSVVRTWRVAGEVQIEAPVTDLPAGVYLVELHTASSAVQTERLVIRP